MTTSIAEAILDGANLLRKAGVSEARLEASSLLGFVLGTDRTFIIAHAEDPITEEKLEDFRNAVEARARGKPLQYITGHQEFFGLDLEVTSDVLIPRPETELVVEAALKLISRDDASAICDVGTGSGCIVISLVHELSQARAVAIDISRPALEVAKRNAARHQVLDRIEFVVSDGFLQLDEESFFDLVVSNPPYVADAAMSGLQREVRDFEPKLALEGGADGLEIIRRWLQETRRFLKSGGHFLFEIGFDQHEAVERLIDPAKWKLLDVYPDLQGIPRIVALKKVG